MNIYRLANPWGLIFLIFPLLCLIIFFLSRYLFKKGVKITGVSRFQTGFSILVPGYYFTIFLIISGLALLAFSISKPQYGIKKERILSNGIDIMIALDTSESMLRKDFLQQPRIEGAKNILNKFVEKRKGDRIGIITFGESAFLHCPATINTTLLKRVIKQITIDPANQSSQKTAMGVGLGSAINRLVNIKDQSESGTKIIILVTDGKNNSGEIAPEAAAEIATQKNIKIYTIGIGQTNEGQVDLEILKLIAQKTEGTFFHAKTSGELGGIFDEINKLEKHKIETYEFARFKNKGYQYATIGLIVLLTGLLLNILFFKRIT